MKYCFPIVTQNTQCQLVNFSLSLPLCFTNTGTDLDSQILKRKLTFGIISKTLFRRSMEEFFYFDSRIWFPRDVEKFSFYFHFFHRLTQKCNKFLSASITATTSTTASEETRIGTVATGNNNYLNLIPLFSSMITFNRTRKNNNIFKLKFLWRKDRTAAIISYLEAIKTYTKRITYLFQWFSEPNLDSFKYIQIATTPTFR